MASVTTCIASTHVFPSYTKGGRTAESQLCVHMPKRQHLVPNSQVSLWSDCIVLLDCLKILFFLLLYKLVQFAHFQTLMFATTVTYICNVCNRDKILPQPPSCRFLQVMLWRNVLHGCLSECCFIAPGWHKDPLVEKTQSGPYLSSPLTPKVITGR